jgi:hypothetical protein
MMLRRLFCVTLLAAALGLPIAAQAPSFTGTWAGELTPTGSPTSRSVTLELVADRDGKVTGTMTGMPRPADVKAGTYDAKSGAVKLQLGIKGEPAVLMTLEGKVTGDTAAGKVITGDGDGDFKLTKQKA